MIALFTDFGATGPYVGQVHAVLARRAGGQPVIDLLHDAPRFHTRAAGHLLAALADTVPADTVFVGVIDPGVGTERDPVVVAADGRHFVGPDNGLFDVVSARAESVQWWRITREREGASYTFDGRDLFAPVAAAIARGEAVPGTEIEPRHDPAAADDLAEVIYIDPYGNAVTALRPPAANTGATLGAGGHVLARGRTFADAEPGEALWLVNSMGLVEIAVNRGSAAADLGLVVGSPVAWIDA